MHEQDKIRHGRELDDLILAKIPDREADPLLYQLVTERMLHRCNDSCRPPDQPHLTLRDQNGLHVERCLKGFPQPFSDETIINDGRMPVYTRPDDGAEFQIGQTTYDNKYVVPYNPYLLKHFQSHINVEYIAYASSMKYLFKYITKGNDQARVYATVAPGHGNMQAAANPPAPANNQQPQPQNAQNNNQQTPAVQQQPQLQNSQANNQPAQQQPQPAIAPINPAPPLRNSQIAMPPPPPPVPINNDQQQNHQPADRANRVVYNEIDDYISKH